MIGGFIEYRCRRCGQSERSLHVPNILTALVELTASGKVSSWSGIPCKITSVHSCADGALGISDAVGAVPDPSERSL